jgi:hypothetical protein
MYSKRGAAKSIVFEILFPVMGSIYRRPRDKSSFKRSVRPSNYHGTLFRIYLRNLPNNVYPAGLSNHAIRKKV